MQLVVGRIGKPHGIRGDVTVDVRTDDPDIWFAPGAVLATDPAASGPLKVAASRWHSGRLLLRFEGHEGRDASEALRGIWLVIDSSDVVTTDDPDDFHDQQLLGLPVVTVEGEEIGTITDILHRAQSLLVVQTAGGDKLVPFVKAIVPEVDLKAGRVVIDPPPGLFDVQ